MFNVNFEAASAIRNGSGHAQQALSSAQGKLVLLADFLQVLSGGVGKPRCMPTMLCYFAIKALLALHLDASRICYFFLCGNMQARLVWLTERGREHVND